MSRRERRALAKIGRKKGQPQAQPLTDGQAAYELTGGAITVDTDKGLHDIKIDEEGEPFAIVEHGADEDVAAETSEATGETSETTEAEAGPVPENYLHEPEAEEAAHAYGIELPAVLRHANYSTLLDSFKKELAKEQGRVHPEMQPMRDLIALATLDQLIRLQNQNGGILALLYRIARSADLVRETLVGTDRALAEGTVPIPGEDYPLLPVIAVLAGEMVNAMPDDGEAGT